MYLEHFGIRETPFTLTPDTSFFYAYDSHVAALNTLLVAARSGDGFIMVTGEVGTGKTLLCRKLLDALQQENYVTAYIHNPYLEPTTLLLAIADELRIPYEGNLNQHQLLKLLTNALLEFSAAGKRVVVCLDEVQAMPVETLETLRLLTNLETEKRKLLQVVLFGQPELHDVLEQPSVRQLKQRIVFSYRLEPLDKEGVEGYVSHRLMVAGYNGRRLFASDAISELHRRTGGIPRLVNVICHKALMAAYGQGKRVVEGDHMRAAIQDTLGNNAKTAHIPLTRTFAYSLLGAAGVFVLAVGIYLLMR
ncbi:MAG: AAA family ATPase [Gammaproteobacteria bacterium]|nr:AAA family ATPase [Gammaproteobacteria bacterium]